MRRAGSGRGDRDVGHLLPGPVQQHGSYRRFVSAWTVGIEANQQPLRARELATRRRDGSRIGHQRLELARGARAKDARRAERGLRRREVGHVDVANLAVERAADASLLDCQPQLDLSRRRVEHQSLWRRRTARTESGRSPPRCRWAPRAAPRMPAPRQESGRGRRDRRRSSRPAATRDRAVAAAHR